MLASQIKTASDLRAFVEEVGGNKLFFDRKTMRMFGDTMKNFGVRKTVVTMYDESTCEVWELYRRRPVKFGNQGSFYFCPTTFHRVRPAI